MRRLIFVIYILSAACIINTTGSGCANVGMPTGGVKDTLPPILVKANPEINSLNFSGNKITLTFNEYIDVKETQTNVLVSPFPKNTPNISSYLRTVTVKLRDTLQPNTTYSINFGNSIIDLNESNPYKDFTYTFSTGNTIDSLEFTGKIQLAETGKVDSTLLVLLYRDATDTAVTNERPDYIAKLKGDGSFRFTHLPAGNYNVYALKDGDGGRYYNSKSETFAFLDKAVEINGNNEPVVLYAYAEEKPASATSASSQTPPKEKKLQYNISLDNRKQDLLKPFELLFNSALENFDSTKMVLSDTNFIPLKDVSITIDSTRKKITLSPKWQPETPLVFIIQNDAVEDSSDNKLAKTDTIRFSTKANSDYGKVVLRFKNLNATGNAVVQFLQQDAIKFSFPINGNEWSNSMFPPGEYEIRILYDANNNGTWDPGNYKEKRQPELSISIKQKLSVKADWDNEREIEL